MKATPDLDILLTPGVFPPDSGGPATFASQIADALTERGYTVRVVTNGTVRNGFDDAFPFDVVRISTSGSVPRRYTRQIRTLVGEIRSSDPDVILSNAFDLQTITAARLTGTPVISKVVGDNAWERARRGGIVDDDIEAFQENRYGPRVELYKLLRTYQTRGSNRVVVPSEYLRNLVEKWELPRERIDVIYNALRTNHPAKKPAQRKNRIITVGRLVSWKGIDGVIEAFEALGTEYEKTELHIVGDGPKRKELERAARNSSCMDRIEFHGRLDHEKVLTLLSESRVFALNSTYEGLPHVVLEAMACGTPVVASAVGGTPEAITDGENGFLVGQGDTEAFRERFERLLGDEKQREEFRQKGYERLETQFDYEEMVDSYVDVIEEFQNR